MSVTPLAFAVPSAEITKDVPPVILEITAPEGIPVPLIGWPARKSVVSP